MLNKWGVRLMSDYDLKKMYKLNEFNSGSKKVSPPFYVDAVPSIGHLITIYLTDTPIKGYLFFFGDSDENFPLDQNMADVAAVRALSENLPTDKNNRISKIEVVSTCEIYDTIDRLTLETHDEQGIKGERIYAFPPGYFWKNDEDRFDTAAFIEFVNEHL